MTLDRRFQHLQTAREILALIVYPIHELADLPRTAGNWFDDTMASREKLFEENETLRTQQLLLRSELMKLEALEAENLRLRELLDSSLRIGERVLVAEITAVDLNPFSRQIVLNKGSLHGVYAGHPLVDANGVMGQVVRVTPYSSTAMIISDPSHAIPITVNRNGLRTIAVGTGTSNNLEVLHLPNNADVEIGDLLVTSGIGGTFPPGYPVAKVITVERNPAKPFAHILAEATAKLDRSREVLLVWRTDNAPQPPAGALTKPTSAITAAPEVTSP